MDTTHHHSATSLVIDREAHEVTIDGLPIHLTNAEFTLLTSLADSPRRAFSSNYLTQVLTNSEWVSEVHALHVTVSRLRRKLGESGTRPRRVVTVHGYGYRFDPDPTPDLAAALASNAQPAPSHAPSLSAFIIVTLDRMFLWSSDSFTQLLGWKPADIQGTNLYQLIHPEDRTHSMAAREELDSGFSAAFLFRFRTASGGYRLVEALARPIIDPSGKTIAFLGEYRPNTTGETTALVVPDPIHMNR